MEDRNIGKKLWLEEFFVSFWGAGTGAVVGLTVTVCCVGEVGEVCCFEATGTELLGSLLLVAFDEDDEVVAILSDDEDNATSPFPVGSVRPLDFVALLPLLGNGESFRLSVSLFNSSMLQAIFNGLSLLALSGTSHGHCFSEFDSILLFVIALC